MSRLQRRAGGSFLAAAVVCVSLLVMLVVVRCAVMSWQSWLACQCVVVCLWVSTHWVLCDWVSKSLCDWVNKTLRPDTHSMTAIMQV